jgi:hypothetical protein
MGEVEAEALVIGVQLLRVKVVRVEQVAVEHQD